MGLMETLEGIEATEEAADAPPAEEAVEERDPSKVAQRTPPKDGLCRRCGRDKPVNRMMLCYPCWSNPNSRTRPAGGRACPTPIGAAAPCPSTSAAPTAIKRPPLRRLARRVFAGAAACALSAAAAVAALAWWIDGADEPARADAIVVLGGGVARAFYAADLYARGLAPEVWIGRTLVPRELALLGGIGVRIPPEPELYREVLTRKGVPPGSLRTFGSDVNSTLEEAEAFSSAFQGKGRRILLVTSREHARRARMIFRRRLRGIEVLAAGTPYEPFSRAWWRSKSLAASALDEAVKTAYYLSGLRLIRMP